MVFTNDKDGGPHGLMAPLSSTFHRTEAAPAIGSDATPHFFAGARPQPFVPYGGVAVGGLADWLCNR